MKKLLPTDSWFVYIVECADGTLYTGVAKDVERRVGEHNVGKKGAKYTRARRPVKLMYQEVHADLSAACRREAIIKKMSRSSKLSLLE